MYKYGMKFSAIRHWQRYGHQHIYLYGRLYGRDLFKGNLGQSSREIGHVAIALAYATQPFVVQKILRGE